jgi:hypothetical protein
MSFTPGGKPARQQTTDTIVRDIWRRLDALERFRPSTGTVLARSDVDFTTDDIAVDEVLPVDIPFGKSFLIFRVRTDVPARIRIYSNAQDRSSDSSRTDDVDPAADIGLILEVITDSSMPTDPDLIDYHLSPMVVGANLPRYAAPAMMAMSAEGVPGSSACLIENPAGGPVHMIFTIMQLE